MYERVESIVTRGHPQQRIQGLSVVGEVDAGESRAGDTGRVERDHLMAIRAQTLYGGPTELAGTAGDTDRHVRSFELCVRRTGE